MMFARMLLILVLGSLCACAETETRTKITFRIDASETLRRQTQALDVTVSSQRYGDEPRHFDDIVAWPVEIVVIPREGNESSREVMLKAVLWGAARRQLASKVVGARFSTETQGVVDVELIGNTTVEEPIMETDSGAADAGKDPKPGKDPETEDDADPETEPMKDAGPKVEPDPVAPKETCATPKTTIVCDDDNPCNGVERCDPGNPAATENGCAGGTSVACADGTTCSSATGTCSTCVNNADGDADGVRSISCGGTDCNDGDPMIGPGKPELCDNKDNDCDGTVDGPMADPDCSSKKPTGGTAACVAASCKLGCVKASDVIKDGVCVAPVTSCPTPNPCAPGGSCSPLAVGYQCACDAGYRAGVGTASRCAARGIKARAIGFEADCANVALDGFVAESKAIGTDFYAACGVSSITTGGMLTRPQLIKPMVAIEGQKDAVALVGGEAEITLSFAPAVSDLAFDVLEVDDVAALKVSFETADAMATAVPTTLAAGSKRAPVKVHSDKPITRVVIKYAPLTATDAWYLDSLSFSLKGCGDGVVDAGEDCDDGDALSCNGCDNACKTSLNGCLKGNACVAGAAAAMSLTGECAP